MPSSSNDGISTTAAMRKQPKTATSPSSSGPPHNMHDDYHHQPQQQCPKQQRLQQQQVVALLPVEGLRACAHLSIIASHASLFAKAHLPFPDEPWPTVSTHLLHTMANEGGIQVDAFFMLTGFLLVHNILLRTDYEYDDDDTKKWSILARLDTIGRLTTTYALRRVKRLLPLILIMSFVAWMMGDVWDVTPNPTWGALKRMIPCWTFTLNYLPLLEYHSISIYHFWTCCVDLHVTILMTAMVHAVRLLFVPSSSSTTTKTQFVRLLQWIFVLFAVLSVLIRACIFEEHSLNFFVIAKYGHPGSATTDEQYQWTQVVYGHQWKTPNVNQAIVSRFLNEMYLPTHTRFGPFFVGGVLACQLFLASTTLPTATTTESKRGSRTTNHWWLDASLTTHIATAMSILILVLPCVLPSSALEGNPPPMAVQLFITAALRVLAAAAVAFLLYRALLPPAHPAHARWLAAWWSHPALQWIAQVSYCSYVIHNRLVWEFTLHPFWKRLLTLGGGPLESAHDHIAYLARLVCLSFVLSLTLGAMVHYGIEIPVSRRLFPTKAMSSTNRKLISTVKRE